MCIIDKIYVFFDKFSDIYGLYSMKYKAVFLDMDHTLCDTNRADTLALLDFERELSREFPHDIAQKISIEYLSAIYKKKGPAPQWQKFAEETEAKYRARLLRQVIEDVSDIHTPTSWEKVITWAYNFMEYRVKYFNFFPGTIEMLKELRKTYSLVLISNGPLYSQEPKIKQISMHQYCDHIILGGNLKYQKPHPSIFLLACQKAKCKPSEAIHVGDILDTDVLGANSVGIDSVWLNSSGNQDMKGNVSPDYTISHINELRGLLDILEKKNS